MISKPRIEFKDTGKPNSLEMGKCKTLGAELTQVVIEGACPHQLVRGDLVLAGHQAVNGRLVLEEDLHPDEGLPALLCEHVPGLGPGQEVGHAALGQAQHSLPEQALADAVLGQDLLDPPDHIIRVEVTVPDTPHDHSHHH